MSSRGDKLLKRYDKALTSRQSWDHLLRDAFALAAPNVDTGFTTATKGQERTIEVVDSTAVEATRDSADSMYSRITPPQSQFFELGLSRPVRKALEENGTIDGIEEALADATEVFFDHFNASNYSLVATSAYVSHKISTGVLLMNEDPRPFAASAFKFDPVALFDVCFEPGPGTAVKAVFQKHTLAADLVEATWPDIELTHELRDKASKDAPPDVDMIVVCDHDLEDSSAEYMVVDPDSRDILVERNYRVSPWIVFRPSVSPGEVMGRGPVLDKLPDIRTLNKAVEYLLKNASLAVSGMWQADDDGVMNLNNIILKPGTIVPKAVGSAGLQALQSGSDFNLSDLVINDLRRSIREYIVGPEFPPLDQSGAMTATETERRVQQHNMLATPSSLRAWREQVVAMVARGMEILDRRGELPPVISDALFRDISAGYVEVVPLSPLARAQDIEQVFTANAALGMASQSGPEMLGTTADLQAYQAWVLEQGGFPSEFINNEQEREEITQQQQAAAQQAQQAEQLMMMADKAKPVADAVKTVSELENVNAG